MRIKLVITALLLLGLPALGLADTTNLDSFDTTQLPEPETLALLGDRGGGLGDRALGQAQVIFAASGEAASLCEGCRIRLCFADCTPRSRGVRGVTRMQSAGRSRRQNSWFRSIMTIADRQWPDASTRVTGS